MLTHSLIAGIHPSYTMSNEILFYDVTIQSSVRPNKAFTPNTLYEYPQTDRYSRLILRPCTQSSSLCAQLQGVALQDRVDPSPRDRVGREEGRREGDQDQAKRVGMFHWSAPEN